MNPHDNEYREQRLANMAKLLELGYKPFGEAFKRTGRLLDLRAAFKENDKISAAGRITSLRDMGKSVFCDINDGSDRMQVYVHAKNIGDGPAAAFKFLDIGDHIGIEGEFFTTRTGEATIKAERWTMLSKSLLTMPEKWHGLKDVEARYRQRYLDLISNPDSRRIFNKRIETIRGIRAFLHDRGFMEVETPMMQAQAGGAAAKPFKTHYDALSTDMFLRIAPELYLKRLLTGGFDRIFELNRNFRNEGLDRSHNPEFTMLEIYEAYSDVRGMKTLVQDLITHLARSVFGTLTVGGEAGPIDLTPPWREVAYRDLITEKMGADWFGLSLDKAKSKACELGLEIEPEWDMTLVTHEIYEKTIEKTLLSPTFVTRFPAALIPLAKTCDDDPSCVDVFELEIGGREIAPAYSELNDPLEQRKRLLAQAAHSGEKIDEEFLEALEYGMPPAGGMGIGIDRLMMVLTGAEAIRDVILFPQLRPLQ